MSSPVRLAARALCALACLAVAAPADAEGARKPAKGAHGAHKPKAPAPGAHAAPAPPAGARPVAPRATPPRAAPPPLALRVQKVTLDNGLRVVLSVDHSTPTVAVSVAYDAGARREPRGQGGLAHLALHLAFDGSANVASGEHERLVAARGGAANATSTADATVLDDELPAGEVPLALWLEAERMKAPTFDAADLARERARAFGERARDVEDAPYAAAQVELRALAYQGYWPYEHDPLGSLRDLEALDVDAVRAFHAAHRGPEHAVLAIAGDIDTDEVVALVHRFFDHVPRGDGAPDVEPPRLAEPTGARDVTRDDAHATSPALAYGWVGPGAFEPDHDALELALRVLADGPGSRVATRLGAGALDVSARAEDLVGPDLFSVFARLAPTQRADDAAKKIDDEIAGLARRAPSAAEVEGAAARARSSFLAELAGHAGRARLMATWELLAGDARLLEGRERALASVTADDVVRASTRWLTPARRARVEVRPPAPPAPAAAARAAAAPTKGRPTSPAAKPHKTHKPSPKRSKK